jgi:hypothetical protein
MKEIPLGHNKFTRVDDDDFAALSRLRWHLHPDGYAVHSTFVNRIRGTVLMSRVILWTPPGLEVDHINGDRLDNRRSNLRRATKAQNKWNADNGDPVWRGVRKNTYANTWSASIRVNGVKKYLGSFKTKPEAKAAYDRAALEHHGPFAFSNRRKLKAALDSL